MLLHASVNEDTVIIDTKSTQYVTLVGRVKSIATDERYIISFTDDTGLIDLTLYRTGN